MLISSPVSVHTICWPFCLFLFLSSKAHQRIVWFSASAVVCFKLQNLKTNFPRKTKPLKSTKEAQVYNSLWIVYSHYCDYWNSQRARNKIKAYLLFEVFCFFCVFLLLTTQGVFTLGKRGEWPKTATVKGTFCGAPANEERANDGIASSLPQSLRASLSLTLTLICSEPRQKNKALHGWDASVPSFFIEKNISIY